MNEDRGSEASGLMISLVMTRAAALALKNGAKH